MFYIKQIKNDDCGFASLKTLIANLYKKEDYLFIPQDESVGPYSYAQLIKIADKYGVKLEGMKTDGDDLEQISQYPFLAALEYKEGEKHMVYVHKVNKRKISIFDPIVGMMKMSKNEFLEKWDKTGLVIDSFEEKNPPIITKDISEGQKAIIALLEVFVLGGVFVSLYFLNGDVNILLPLTIMICSLIIELVLKQYLFKITKQVDENHVYSLEKLPKDQYDYLVRVEDYKKSLVKSPLNIVSDIILFIVSITLLMLNSKYSFISIITVLLIILVDIVFVNPYFIRKDMEITKNEKGLSRLCNLEGFRECHKAVQSRSLKYANLKLVYFAIKLLLIGASVLISMLLAKNYSSLFALVNIMLVLIINQEGERITHYQKDLDAIKENKTRIYNAKMM